MRQILNRIFRTAVAWSFIATALRFGSALFVLPLLLRSVPSEELGLWYVFLSFGALATLVDFGFSTTISRVTAYLWAGARELSPYGLPKSVDLADRQRGVEPNMSLLSRLIAALKIYYGLLGGAALLLLLTIGGWWIYKKTYDLPNAQSLRLAFVVYAIAVALNLIGGMWLYALNGINRVRESLQLNTAVLVENYVIAIAGLLSGLRIWALVIANFAMGLSERIAGRHAYASGSVAKRVANRNRLGCGVLRTSGKHTNLLGISWFKNHWLLWAHITGSHIAGRRQQRLGRSEISNDQPTSVPGPP